MNVHRVVHRQFPSGQGLERLGARTAIPVGIRIGDPEQDVDLVRRREIGVSEREPGQGGGDRRVGRLRRRIMLADAAYPHPTARQLAEGEGFGLAHLAMSSGCTSASGTDSFNKGTGRA